MRRGLIANTILLFLTAVAAEGCAAQRSTLSQIQDRMMGDILSESIGSSDSFVPNCPGEGVYPKLNSEARAIAVAWDDGETFLGMPQVEKLRIIDERAVIPADLRWSRHDPETRLISRMDPRNIPETYASGAKLVKPKDFSRLEEIMYWAETRPPVDDDKKTTVSGAYQCGCRFKEGSVWRKAGERYEREVKCRQPADIRR